MTQEIRLGLAALVLVGLVHRVASATIIFDNTDNIDEGKTSTSQPQLGNEVTAAGTDRTVTEVDIGFTESNAGIANLQAFLYANDGPSGAPGTLLGQSAVLTSVSINSAHQLVAFSIPSIVVPSTFTLTAAITNATSDIGLAKDSTGASTGAFVQAWVGGPGSFSSLPSNFETEARVIAVPEPALLTASLAMAGMFMRKRRSLD